ncbi:MAG: EAL domain-containing protein [Pseudomonadota bacterium]|uniref:Response regulator receiver modulated diguanylate cyclase/phosphodiesterase with PAS/PAC sensor n=1 Tax=Methylophaga aminisulfidivorans MP TaxID=1026882 RepID=F5SZ72_9GAMM|nr:MULTISPECIES: EAL domain-containing protein [Methylophaga]EGL54595.1 response regulator receiver modulated diguanylate cyclase/phosphodiesterase with PAS/PAC sensor [Methylophaga aminisulfidivorans MP]MEC9411088.1 EAL domain-containing protein [Pseudomonadota bacterium]HIC45691.1 EAL domain-containing protein [Methylophaga sp.]HIM41231.1 EAL domain-containing protein [Methylophaga aminisulfidivorans]
MARAEGILRVLIIDSSLTDADVIVNVLRSAGHAVRATREDKPAAIEKLLSAQNWELILCREHVADVQPMDILNLIQHLDKDLPCIIITDDKTHEADYFTTNAKDIVLFEDKQRLQFVINREIDNLFIRRLARRNERALRESEKRSKTLLDSSRDAVAYMHEGMHIYVNQAYLNLFGYHESEDVAGLPILDLFSADDHPKFKAVFRQFTEQPDAPPVTLMGNGLTAEGVTFKAEIQFSHARVEGEDCTQVVIRDDTVINEQTAPVVTLIDEHDQLTGLYNRSRFIDELEKTVRRAAEGEGDAQLLYLTLDDFLSIKEKVGLGTSEVILKSVSDLLQNNLAEHEVIGHYGDQVFTIIVPHHDDAYIDERAESFRRTIDDYVSHVAGKTIDLHCSVGIARINESQLTAEAVLENADRAAMKAQHAGGNQVMRFHAQSSEIEQQSSEVWHKQLQTALQEDKFTLFYQPIVSLHGEEQEFYEVLLRLQVNDEFIAADKFIHHAVQLKMMTEIDKWVIRSALKALTIHRQRFPKTRFFIKLSEQSLHEEAFVDWLSASLSAQQLTARSLIFEVSETMAIDNVEQVSHVIERLQSLGCEFGLEHFGSGIDFSNSLKAFNVDYLKINGTFVENMAHDAENQAAVKAIIEMTKEAGKRSIAEFVSDANSLALLWRLGVDYAQGYYIHEPSAEMNYNFEDDEL